MPFGFGKIFHKVTSPVRDVYHAAKKTAHTVYHKAKNTVIPSTHSIGISITNNTQSSTEILLYHKSLSYHNSKSFSAGAGETVGTLPVRFKTGVTNAEIMDNWGVILMVTDGTNQGVYVNEGSLFGDAINDTMSGILRSVTTGPLQGILGSFVGPIDLNLKYKECQLEQDDVGTNPVFSVDTNTFHINLPSGSTSASMKKLDFIDPRVQHIFVLMLENHSFDNIFAMSGIPNITAATTSDSNDYSIVSNGKSGTVHVQKGAPDNMPTDPGHEFDDVIQQLTGQSLINSKGEKNTLTPYHEKPPINNSGFADNYANSGSEGSGLPSQDEINNVMRCFDTPNQLPVIHKLATEFAICDHWFSALPGPTWPNRYFVHGASSSGMHTSPSSKWIAVSENTPDVDGYSQGFEYKNGSIFDKLGGNEVTGHNNWRIYQEKIGSVFGRYAQVASIEGIHQDEVLDFANFADDVNGMYTTKYTFIEPSYGDTYGNTYQGGSSQHPMDGMEAGESLIKRTYEAIRKSPIWDSSLLIITYDEHGGFYDHVAPPTTVNPGTDEKFDSSSSVNNALFGDQGMNFDFKRLGVRVPAVVISPYIPKGTVAKTQFEHSSVPATIEKAFGLTHLTERDKNANDLLKLLTLKAARQDCPTTLPDPVPDNKDYTAHGQTTIEEGLNESGNNIGFLQVSLKAALHRATSQGQKESIIEHYHSIRTRAQAMAFTEEYHQG